MVVPASRRPARPLISTRPEAAENSLAFLLLELGGSGSQGGNRLQELADLGGCRATFERVQFDLDKGQTSTAKFFADLSLSPAQAREIKANARRFDPAFAAAVRHVGYLLDPMEVEAGARSTRGVTQIAVMYHLDRVLKAVAKAVASLLARGRFTRIQPIILTSTGGGMGSAASVVIPAVMKQPKARARMLAGLDPDLLMAPIVMAAAPYAYVRNYTTRSQGTKVLANYYATLRELDGSLLRREVAYVVTMGFSNSAGMINDTPERMVDVLATSALQFMANFSHFKGRWVDSVPSAGDQTYRGLDLPENIFPTVRALREKFYPEER